MRGLYKERGLERLPGTEGQIVALGRAMATYDPRAQFLFEGHVDASARSSADFWLAAQRASRVREWVVEKYPGLKGRIRVTAKGGTEPAVPNINQTSRERNRRIEISVLN